MIYDNLYEEVLLKPAYENVNQLKIISGYATSAMAYRHIEKLKELNQNISVSLIVGMCSVDGVSLSNHKGFQQIIDSKKYSFRCSYVFKQPQVHSKVYIWMQDKKIVKAFIGSANYTQNAFMNFQREILAEIDSSCVVDYFNLIESDSIFCNHPEIENSVKLLNDKLYFKKQRESEISETSLLNEKLNLPSVTVSLLDRYGEIQKKAGLNWGQREGREPNQAYIQLRPEIYKSDFFPVKTHHFTVFTDDNKSIICTRGTKTNTDGAAILSTLNNSLIGEYFRNRLGLANGAFITKSDLENYGRTDVTFYKIDDENYLMDFSVL